MTPGLALQRSSADLWGLSSTLTQVGCTRSAASHDSIAAKVLVRCVRRRENLFCVFSNTSAAGQRWVENEGKERKSTG